MRRYIVNRFLHMIPVLIIISLILFVLLRVMPVDPIYSMIGEDSEAMTPEMHAIIVHDLGLDRPLPVQYLSWVTDMVTGNWGN